MEQLFVSPLCLQICQKPRLAGRWPWLLALLPALCLILLLAGATPPVQADQPALARAASPTDPLPDQFLFAIGAPAAIQAQPTAPASPVLFDCTGVSEIPQAECQALVALYNGTDGANWRDKSGWLTTNTPCSWYGVSCASGHVTQLNLSSNQLSGGIPPELGNLASLQGLYLYNNQLSGSIPPQLGNLTNLQRLDLFNNQLSSSIPPELSNLASLRWLDLTTNQLSGSIPSQLCNLTNLLKLGLNSNQLGGNIPTTLGNLTNLQGLDLAYNQLSGNIPPQLGNLANLQWLYLARNQLSGSIPPQLGNLANLGTLWLSQNQLSASIPPELGNLVSLQYFYLDSNQLSGSIPPQLCNPVNLMYLDLGYNKLTAGPACIDSKDPDWAQTQTVPPANLQATPQSGSSVQLTWTPILYTGDGEIGRASCRERV